MVINAMCTISQVGRSWKTKQNIMQISEQLFLKKAQGQLIPDIQTHIIPETPCLSPNFSVNSVCPLPSTQILCSKSLRTCNLSDL
jgi:hypothetical protein